jgi:subtilisin family serine protease
MNIPALHEMGLRGAGVRIGVIDSGFRWRTHEALTSATVIAEYDFIEDDADTANSANDHPSQDRHGTQVLALIAGQSPGNLYGAAFEAEFVLAKTEDISGENRIEMDYFIAGLEFLEQQGCDIISASIVYGIFPSEPDIPFTNLDGKTEPISLAVGALYERGVVMVNAA